MGTFLNSAGRTGGRIQTPQRKAHWIHKQNNFWHVHNFTVGSRTMSKTVNLYLWKINKTKFTSIQIHSKQNIFLVTTKPSNAFPHLDWLRQQRATPQIITQYVTIFMLFARFMCADNGKSTSCIIRPQQSSDMFDKIQLAHFFSPPPLHMNMTTRHSATCTYI